jgi:hypothetical protein
VTPGNLLNRASTCHGVVLAIENGITSLPPDSIATCCPLALEMVSAAESTVTPAFKESVTDFPDVQLQPSPSLQMQVHP